MTSQDFVWYVFPWIVSAITLGWIAYDYYNNPGR
ncbi:hypothetical protein C8J35_101668 [Rhizobium sp. PP-F2F-G38]|nr:hypothetical protein C8J32_102528 [Rhizobium sp. PP-CC-3A-592]PYE37396.1 hypothetical protein C8J37_101669 [Rhizobium sp. PP-WC-1G-195]PYE44980.1 hypothetical protein DFI02_102418 [Rhizobium sp. PP-F2F-G20b]PYF00848.1 hypothetical protein C8J35_101668 [Rhizobium sp. PP-F2F-G38]TCL93853.1 hypothetical protein C8J38_102280 [Rhizobium sp. PP-WC-2G-219]TCM58622.1 hypothetical protein C8J36_101528 [Rhizobium sp. PP-F2F-G48]